MPVMRESRKPVTRGCGVRKAGGVYLCTATGPNGMPIEAFLVDPVKSMMVDCFRAPIVVPDPTDPAIKHLAIWVGKEHYPSLVDFVEEVRRLGASRRIPEDFDFSVLTPGRSRMFLIHPHAFTTRCDAAECPKGIEDEGHGTAVPCIGAHWHYVKAMGSTLEGNTVRTGEVTYALPSLQYDVDPSGFLPGAFLQLPITHVEYQARDKDDAGPNHVEERAGSINLPFVIVDEE